MCLLLFVLGHNLVHAEEPELIVDDAELQSGKGVIIELEKEKTGRTAVTRDAGKKNKPGRKQVELIVGGQGEDGVAKRGTLIIDD